MKDNKLVIRNYTIDDEHRLTELFKSVFGEERDVEYWKWKYRSNSQGHGWITIAEINNEIVGQYCTMRFNLNFMGKEIVAGQTCDLVVREDYRKKHLFSQLAAKNYDFAHSDGMQAFVGFPNRNSYPGGMRNVGTYRITNLKYYYYRLGFRKIVGREADIILRRLFNIPNLIISDIIMPLRIKLGTGGFYNLLKERNDYQIMVCDHLPDDLIDLLHEYLNYEVLSGWKDIKYLKWRYENHPTNKYTFHVLYHKDVAEGLAVCKETVDSVSICEVIHRTKDLMQTVILLRNLINYYIQSPVQKIEFYGRDNGYFDHVFAASGFNIQPLSGYVLVGKVLENEILDKIFMLPDNWSVSYGDTDVV